MGEAASLEPERRTPIRRDDLAQRRRAGSETDAPQGRFMGRKQGSETKGAFQDVAEFKRTIGLSDPDQEQQA